MSKTAQVFPNTVKRFRSTLTHWVGTVAFGIFASSAALAAKKPASQGIIKGHEQIDADSVQFEIQTALIRNAKECFPLHVREMRRVGILYLYCSDEALADDGEGEVITEHFSVPQPLARRYNFWRRVYSLWSKEQYVLHSAVYPEVIFEVYDGTRLDMTLEERQREKQIKDVAKLQRLEYAKILMTMHKFRGRDVSELTPSMQRIARSMAHISDPNKYMVAARALRLQRGQRDYIARGLAVGPKYMAAIQEEFESQGLAKELANLAYIESSFNLLARSKVGASGVFQIMPATGEQYLVMMEGVDERNDPIKAAKAAAKLLRFNHSMLGTWPLAITAYNHGVGGIRRAMRATGSNDLVYLINNYTSPSFQFASKNFYTGFLGMLATLQDAERIFPEIPKVEPLAFEKVRLGTWTNIPTIKKRYNLSNEDIAAYNPDITRTFIRSGGTLPRGYVLKIPAQIPAANAVRVVSTDER
jgi:membrane-bound lytic murein transglycosylase D